MSSDRQPPLNLVRQLVVGNLDKPLFELLDRTLACLMQGLDARAAFYGKIDENTLEILAAQVESGPSIEPGLRMPLEASFASLEEDALGGITNIRDATKSQPHKSLPMRQQLGIVSYLGAPLRNARGEVNGTLAVIGKGPRTFTDADQDLLLVVAGLVAPRLRPEAPSANGQGRAPVSAVRLASNSPMHS